MSSIREKSKALRIFARELPLESFSGTTTPHSVFTIVV
jgi:hypothetical protein